LAAIDPTTLSDAAQAAYRAAESRVIVNAYLGIAAALMVIAAVVWLRRNALVERPADQAGGLRAALGLLRRPRFAFGTLGIFLYVGAEVSVGSLIVNYLMRADTLALGQEAAGAHVPYYWGGAMIGRFIGALLLRYVSPGKALTGAAGGVLALLAISGTATGLVSAWSLLAIGLFNSIMFPTIFSLASERLGVRTPEGSGLICMAIVGGAIVPPLTGWTADQIGLKGALLVPALCYAIILAFGLYARRPAPALDDAAA
ncbi:MAG TPA: glucose/galactose MFS transporter, partial [Sphingomonas sp.]